LTIMQHSRSAVLARLRAKVAARKPIIGGGAGTGISAKSEEAGGIDLLVVYNSGRYRMAGRGSLAGLMPYGNANQIVKEMAYEILPVARNTPVLAGVCGTDPFMLPKLFLKELAELGYCGIQNFPTVGLISGDLRAALEETEMGYDKEVEIVRLAREMDLLTTPYAFDEAEALAMADAGADVVVAHMGCTSGGSIGPKSVVPLDECARRVARIADAVKRRRPEVLVLCHGGAISSPEDAQVVLSAVPACDGFYGASSTERLPTEIAIRDTIRRFMDLRLAPVKET
jgi:predicted TIM-barrel enzyme